MHRRSSIITQQAKILTWKSITGIIFGCLAILVATSWYAWKVKQETKHIVLSAERQQALKNMNISSCDGKVCVKVQTKASVWGKDEDFLLIAE